MHTLLRDGGQSVCLIKPQFEAGKENIGKKGVVRDKSVHEDVVRNITSFASENGFKVMDVDFSPIKGPEGNIEYLMHIEKTDEGEMLWSGSVEELVERSHENLDK
jgi:23S rRNA (cytidine1920-2'-O)/16S rRNA (cytidine1409-2'-O)-methyltransferase